MKTLIVSRVLGRMPEEIAKLTDEQRQCAAIKHGIRLGSEDKSKGFSFYRDRAVAVAKWIELPMDSYKEFVNYLLDVSDAETNCRKLMENNGLHGNHTIEGRMLEIKRAFEQKRTPNCVFSGNRIELHQRVEMN
jgi:hypothetical protein